MIIRAFYKAAMGFLFLALAGGGGGGNSQGSGTLQLGITDAPVDSAEKVVIYFEEMVFHHESGDIVKDVYDPVTNLKGYSIDLLTLQGGQWTGLVDSEIPAGHYSWIRLKIDLNKSYIQIAGQQYGLRCTSCENNGYKLNTSFNVEADAVLAYMLDFDLRKSITEPQPNNTNPNKDYILRPTLRTIKTAASGKLAGSVDETLIAELGGDITGCSVYVFDGHDATPDDVYIPFDSSMPTAQNNPVSSAKVVEAERGGYEYTVAFLPEGLYTAALTCEAEKDSADSDDTLYFAVVVNAEPITAGATTIQNFTLPVASP
jgi:hypothetical protein